MDSARSPEDRTVPITDTNNQHAGWMIFCPGCRFGHLFDPRWTFNGNRLKPTFRASMLVRMGKDLKEVCHSFVTDGRIEFLSDCTHAMAGKTVDLPAYDFAQRAEDEALDARLAAEKAAGSSGTGG